MTLPNDSIAVTPGSGALVATHIVASKEYQAVVIADPDGHIKGTHPVYRMSVIGSAVGANKVHCDLWNGDAAAVLRVISARVGNNLDTAVTGTVAAIIALTRTTAIGTGGTAHTAENSALTGISINKLDTASPAIDADVTARLAPGGGATAGPLIRVRNLFMEETNAGAALAGVLGAEFVSPGEPVIVRPSQGLRFVQGAVASVGTLNFEITFELVA